MINKENLEKYKEKRQLKLQETMEIMNLTLEIKCNFQGNLKKVQ